MLHIAASDVVVAVKSKEPKLNPVTVTDAPPERGMLRITFDNTGASKDSPSSIVPATAPTVTKLLSKFTLGTLGAAHATLVDDDHDAVRHAAKWIPDDCVKSSAPKFSPTTVTEAPPDNSRFNCACEIAGESKLNVLNCVPMVAPTVTCTDASVEITSPQRHITVVPDAHAAVAHPTELRAIVEVNSCVPKLRPVTVTEWPPVDGALPNPFDTTGPSKVKRSNDVPAAALSVSDDKATVPVLPDMKHLADVAELHCEVPQAAAVNEAVPVKSWLPKLKPVTVTASKPLPGKLTGVDEIDGRSKLKLAYVVPETAETVKKVFVTSKLPANAALRHCTLVLLLQDAVWQAAWERTTVAETSLLAKLSPETVTEAPPDGGTFAILGNEVTGASNVNVYGPVPATAATVTRNLLKAADPEPARQRSPV